MYAIIEDSGSQIRASVGDKLTIDLRELAENAKKISFDRVLMISDPEKGSSRVGVPYIEGASVEAKIIESDVKGDKIDVIKFKRRKGYRRKQGHRQHHMLVEVTKITEG